jgi:hypothetical protein
MQIDNTLNTEYWYESDYRKEKPLNKISNIYNMYILYIWKYCEKWTTSKVFVISGYFMNK